MTQIASLPHTTQAKLIQYKIDELMRKYSSAREFRYVDELRKLGEMVKALEESLRGV